MPFLKDKRKLKSNSKKLIHLTNKNGLRHAVFNIYGDRYTGDWKRNLKAGKGQLITRTFRLYEGDFEDNFRHGFGVFCYRLENKVFILEYRGNYKRGLKNGFGAKHYPDGGYYLGHFKNDKRHGFGQMWYANGAYYDGDWMNDIRHGLGMWVRPDGNRYEGAWASDLRHGKGRFFHLDNGQMQDGVWKEDLCVYSIMIDIPFRQTALEPTQYPIQIIEVLNVDKICNEEELKALSGYIRSCLSFATSQDCTNSCKSS